MIDDLYPQQIRTEISTYSSTWEEYDYLRPFTCGFQVSESGDEATDKYLGVITGWFAISVVGRPIRNEADAISADSATIGSVAQEILDAQDWGEDLIEHVLLVDRISIDASYRGQGMLRYMVDVLVSSLGFHRAGCLLVTQPEPQKPGGGPYADGPKRSRALSGLRRSLKAAGFKAWDDGTCYSRIIEAQ